MTDPTDDRLARVAGFLADNGSLFFDDGLRLKDGRPTPYFVNLGRINTGRTAPLLAGLMADLLLEGGLVDGQTVIIGPSYKGPPLAALIAAALYRDHGLEVGYDYDRKEAKTHGEASGKGTIFVTGAAKAAHKAIIVDDVATSMATKVELIDKITAEAPELKITAVAIAVDREQTQPVYDDQGRVILGRRGEDAVAAFTARTAVPVVALAPIRKVIDWLHRGGRPVLVRGEMRPLSQADKAAFDDYLATYGRD